MRRLLRLAALLLGLATSLYWSPPDVASATGVAAIAAGSDHTCAVTEPGAVKCWGLNLSGQLGNGVEGISNSNPIPVDVLAGPGGAPINGVSSLSGGFGHTCALMEDTGGIKCWGKNGLGQLGDGQGCGTTCPIAVDVPDVATGASAVASGGNHTCAVTEMSGIKCWGLNHFGQLGAETTDFCVFQSFPCSTTPVSVLGLNSAAVAVAAGLEHTCAVTAEGGVACWGKNHVGQLGDGTRQGSTSPASVCQQFDVVAQQCTELLAGAIAIAAASTHTCALVRVEPQTMAGGVRCWGSNVSGQLGGATAESCFGNPCSTTSVGVVGLESGVVSISAWRDHTCAVTTAGGVLCWGANGFGQLGDGTTTDRTTPVAVPGLESGVAEVVAGEDHTCVRTIAGGIRCWGLNQYGQLGDGTIANRTTPAKVFGLGEPPDSDSDGCTDNQEQGSDPAAGALRDPKNFWDFFDADRDGSVGFGDFLLLVQHFGTNDNNGEALINRNSDPLTTPDPGPGSYHPLFDRGAMVGPSPWNVGPPDGTIAFGDFLALVGQFGHSCTQP